MSNNVRDWWFKRLWWLWLFLAFGALVLLAWYCWDWLANENSAILRNLGLLLFGILGMPLAWWRTKIADKNAENALNNTKIADRNSVTDIFTRAIEQLGSVSNNKPNIEVRLGAIYSLEKLSKTNHEYYQAIIDILASYVRENAPIPPESKRKPNDITRTDVQTAMTVLSRRTPKSGEPQLNLVKVYLPRVILNNKACLTGANLDGAYLREAKLNGADLQRAKLVGADLQGAHLGRANLRYARLRKAKLEDATLIDAVGLSCGQLKRAINWEHTYRDETLACGCEIPESIPF